MCWRCPSSPSSPKNGSSVSIGCASASGATAAATTTSECCSSSSQKVLSIRGRGGDAFTDCNDALRGARAREGVAVPRVVPPVVRERRDVWDGGGHGRERGARGEVRGDSSDGARVRGADPS